MITGHGGNIHQVAGELGLSPRDIIDMSSNINPLGPPPGLMAFLRSRLDAVGALPDVAAGSAIGAFADRFGLDSRRVVSGNGTTQMIYCLPDALNLKKALIVGPTYSDYGDACRLRNTDCRFLITDHANGFHPDIDEIGRRSAGADAVFICNPNNPTGSFIEMESVRHLCRSHPDTLFVIDEAYLPFMGLGEAQSMMPHCMENVVVLHSMSKIFSIPGLRIGFLVSSPAIAQRIRPYLQPWSVNALAQAAVGYLMKAVDETADFIDDSVAFLKEEKKRMAARLGEAACIRLFPSHTSFMLMRLSAPLNAETVLAGMLKERILIRDCANFNGLSPRYVRISIKTAEANALAAMRLMKIDGEALADTPPASLRYGTP